MLEATVGDPTTLLLQRTIDRIDAHCADGPVLIILEDLHWADPTTLTFLHHLATRSDPRALAIVATTRPAPAGTALHHLLGDLEASMLAITGLDDDHVAQLAARAGTAAGADHLDDHVRAALTEAGGNPLLVLATLEAGGSGVSGPIGARVQGLPADLLRLLQPAAVAGATIRLDLLSALTGRGTLEVMELLEAAVHAGVVVHGDAVYGFRHDLYRTAVLDTLPTDAIEALHLDIARALERLGATRLEIAEHLASGARPGNLEAVATLTATAEELAERDPVTALAISDLAVGLLAGAPMPEPLQVVRIASLATCGRTAEAEVLGEALLATGVSAEVEARVRRDLALAAFVQGRSADAETHMRAAAELAPDPQHAARARTELAWAQFLSLDRAGALAGAAIGERHGDAFTRVAAGSLLCWLGLWSLDTNTRDTCGARRRDPRRRRRPRRLAGVPALAGRSRRAPRVRRRSTTPSPWPSVGRRMAAAAGTSWAVPAYDAMLATAAWRLRRPRPRPACSRRPRSTAPPSSTGSASRSGRGRCWRSSPSAAAISTSAATISGRRASPARTAVRSSAPTISCSPRRWPPTSTATQPGPSSSCSSAGSSCAPWAASTSGPPPAPSSSSTVWHRARRATSSTPSPRSSPPTR
jgi:hypothetical protein